MMRVISGLFCVAGLFMALPARAYEIPQDWLLQPTAGYDTATVTVDNSHTQKAQIVELRTNYYAGRRSGTALSATILYGSNLSHSCSFRSPLRFARNALIIDTFTAHGVLECDESTFPVRMRVDIQYQVHNTLFIEGDIAATEAPVPGLHLPTAIRFKSTLKYGGSSRNDQGCTATVLDLGGPKSRFPVSSQGDCGAMSR